VPAAPTMLTFVMIDFPPAQGLNMSNFLARFQTVRNCPGRLDGFPKV
jgi:hypothetical protein